MEEHMRKAQKGLPVSFPAVGQDSTEPAEMLTQGVSSPVTSVAAVRYDTSSRVEGTIMWKAVSVFFLLLTELCT